MKKIILLSLFGFFISVAACAQRHTFPVNDSDIIFTKVENEAQFPGGLSGFKTFLQKNLNPDVPINHRAPAGTYTVVVRFIVGRDGTVYNIAPETNMGYGMEKEVVRVIELSPNWIPATQNGIPVNAYHRQPVTFVVSNL